MSEQLFGSSYHTVGSTSEDLLLKTRGHVKVQIGNVFKDLLDLDSNNYSITADGTSVYITVNGKQYKLTPSS